MEAMLQIMLHPNPASLDNETTPRAASVRACVSAEACPTARWHQNWPQRSKWAPVEADRQGCPVPNAQLSARAPKKAPRRRLGAPQQKRRGRQNHLPVLQRILPLSRAAQPSSNHSPRTQVRSPQTSRRRLRSFPPSLSRTLSQAGNHARVLALSRTPRAITPPVR